LRFCSVCPILTETEEWRKTWKEVTGRLSRGKHIMPQYSITIPERLQLNVQETKRFLAAKMYEAGKLSLGQSAELAGLSKRAFSEILGDYNVSLINYPLKDILRDAGQF
jgi:predicted HTH domain antitoxin